MFTIRKKLSGTTPVDRKELAGKIAILINVRYAGEYKAGHVPGSTNVLLNNIRTIVADLKRPGKPVIPACAAAPKAGWQKIFTLQPALKCIMALAGTV